MIGVLQLLGTSSSSSSGEGVTEMVYITWHTAVCVSHLFVSSMGNTQEVLGILRKSRMLEQGSLHSTLSVYEWEHQGEGMRPGWLKVPLPEIYFTGGSCPPSRSGVCWLSLLVKCQLFWISSQWSPNTVLSVMTTYKAKQNKCVASSNTVTVK